MPIAAISFILTFTFIAVIWGKCPEECICGADLEDRKRVICNKGGLVEIPTLKMDLDIQVLIITAPPHNSNELTIGRIFLDFHDLEEVRITYSKLPAIGDSSFWPGKNLKILDLSHNNITFIRDKDFYGLRNLRVLDLSYNGISASPSAPFRLLSSLTTLSLARNKFRTLVPRFFYMLTKLEKLDLSGNPLKDIDPENLKDVRPLRRFHLAKCQLTRLHSLVYQQLPNLEELDLRDNYFTYFSPEEFRHLKRLKYLHLDGNNLTLIVEKTFDGHNLRHLGLSRNRIFKFSKCAFCNLSIQQLDLSYNQLVSIHFDALSPIAHSLESLDVSFNEIDSEELELALSPLYKLKKLSLSGMKLDHLSDDAFINNIELKTLDISYNLFSNLSGQTIQPLHQIEEIDLSHNLLEYLDPSFLEKIDNISTLHVLHLHSNPWSCHRCSVLTLLRWIRQSILYSSTCDVNYESSTCMRCASPLSLEGRALHSLRRLDLEPCNSLMPQSRVFVASSNVVIIVVITVVILFIIIFTVSVIIYKKQGASYYTHEGDRTPTLGVLGIPSDYADINGRTFSEERRRAYFVTLDRIDELAGEKIVAAFNSN
ncbi:leucine-rich repeat-containing protein 15-like [Parasteatoda tepidariorum]|uniref:leucine-rich repeat-containing protein 15-like n=1 Tax=Parasteatoda tepidariorum TaxID=114398 RepID=UPI00077FB65C|nr:leucine-rich repeats and immunoglobulin-like domains protein 3 [Parasteatoda tepidariorum]